MQKITNAKLTELRKLQQKKYRTQLGKFTIEGEKGVNEAKWADMLEYVVISEEFKGKPPKDTPPFTISKRDAESIASTSTFPGIIGVCKIPAPARQIDGHVLVLDRINDPGNVGTLLRSADWFGVNMVIILPGTADVYSPKVVRATMGAIFRLNIVTVQSVEEALERVQSQKIELAALDMGGKPLKDLKTTQNYGLIVGSESHGVAKELREAAETVVSIPGSGDGESLNAGVAGSIAMYHVANSK